MVVGKNSHKTNKPPFNNNADHVRYRIEISTSTNENDTFDIWKNKTISM